MTMILLFCKELNLWSPQQIYPISADKEYCVKALDLCGCPRNIKNKNQVTFFHPNKDYDVSLLRNGSKD